MKDIIENIFGFLYTLSMGDYIFFVGTFLIILAFIYILYLLKREDESTNKNEDVSYLEDTIKSIEKDYKPRNIELTDYEKEQEETAIISYQELIKNKNKYTVNYDEEYIPTNDEISVKKISLDKNEISKEKEIKLDVKLLNYGEYEDFLTALKQLQQNLTN